MITGRAAPCRRSAIAAIDCADGSGVGKAGSGGWLGSSASGAWGWMSMGSISTTGRRSITARW